MTEKVNEAVEAVSRATYAKRGEEKAGERLPPLRERLQIVGGVDDSGGEEVAAGTRLIIGEGGGGVAPDGGGGEDGECGARGGEAAAARDGGKGGHFASVCGRNSLQHAVHVVAIASLSLKMLH